MNWIKSKMLMLFLLMLVSYASHAQRLDQLKDGRWQYTNTSGATRLLDLSIAEDLNLVTQYTLQKEKLAAEAKLSDLITLEIKEKENQFQLNETRQDQARLQKSLLEQSLKTEKKEMSESQIQQLKKDVSDAKEKESSLKKRGKQLVNQIGILKAILASEPPKRTKEYAEYLKSYPPEPIENQIIAQSNISIESKNTKQMSSNLPTVHKRMAAQDYAVYNIKVDPYFNPTTKPCHLEFNGTDEFTGKNRKDHAPELLFFYTPEAMHKFYPDKDYMNCKASLSSVSGGAMFLNLYFTIASKDAPKLFGGFEKGTVINLKFLDGDNLAIINNRTDPGIYEPGNQYVTFRAQCNLGANIQEEISKKSLDKIRVTWQTGYEDYEVYDVDLLKREFKCLF